MRRLLYIIFAAVTTLTAIVAQTPEKSETPVFDTADSIAADVADNDSMLSDSAIQPAAVTPVTRKRRINPVNNEATRTQNHNDALGDSLRMLERRRQRSHHYHDENGNLIMVDTVTGEEWVDSTMLPKPPKMKQPLLFGAEVGVNIWDPLMRAFGQKYGGVDFSAALNLHNRYIPTVEIGIGMANKTPAAMNYTYKTPAVPYFKLGIDYNFIYNSDPDYRFVAGVRYGFSAFSYSLSNVTFNDTYWGEKEPIDFPTQKVTAGWFELVLGLRVKIYGPLSAGWMFRYHSLLHQTHPVTGDAWYIPGYGTSSSSITGSFSFVYNINLAGRKKTPDPEAEHPHDENTVR